jgi:hypothetical protein
MIGYFLVSVNDICSNCFVLFIIIYFILCTAFIFNFLYYVFIYIHFLHVKPGVSCIWTTMFFIYIGESHHLLSLYLLSLNNFHIFKVSLVVDPLFLKPYFSWEFFFVYMCTYFHIC